MLDLAIGVFLVLHGFVHGWYVVLSQGWVELEDAMGWTGHSWLLSGVLPGDLVLALASGAYVLATVGVVAGGVGYVLGASWATPVLLGAAVVSMVTIVAMWNGRLELLVEQGLVGVLLNVAVVAGLLLR